MAKKVSFDPSRVDPDPREPTMTKSWLGFDSRYGRLLAGGGERIPSEGLVLPGDTVTIVSRPQISFAGERLSIYLLIASSFLIHSLKVGNAEQTVSFGPIPADAFATRMDQLAEIEEIYKQHEAFEIKVQKGAYELLGQEWPLPMVGSGTDIMFTVENISDTPKRFIAGFFGRTDYR